MSNAKLSAEVTLSERKAVLLRAQNAKMASSPHAYVRGNTLQFYKWLADNTVRNLPSGPPIWICGDCHNGNLGPVADTHGHITVQIRDLDQTVIGNPAHDLIRLGLSLASAIRGSNLPGVTTARMLEQMVLGYEQALEVGEDVLDISPEMPDAVNLVMRKAAARSWKHLAKERLDDDKPTIPLGRRFWAITKSERNDLESLFEKEHVKRLATLLRSRSDEAKVEFLDAAYWMKGCSSLGKLRYAVLLSVKAKKSSDVEYCLMDVKEAIESGAPLAANATIPEDNAVRVVTGAQHLSPALGDRMRAGQLGSRSVFVRELLPQDLKIEIERLDRDETMRAAHFLASVVGTAHARQMDVSTRKAWQADIARHRTKALDAPSWLWSSVVELLVAHEHSYLEHCRRYALAMDAA